MATIGIAGAGFQGRTVGYRLALGGHRVVLFDPSEAQRARALEAMKSRRARALVTAVDALEGLAGCDLVIENVPEDPALKRRVLAALEAAAPRAIVASNSSSHPPDALAADLADPARFLNLHFLGPGYGNDVLEVVAGRATAPAALEAAEAMLREAGLDPVRVGAGVAFVFNRINDAGVSGIGLAVDAGLVGLDGLVRYGLPSAGRVRQLDVLDHIGLDVVAAVLAACREAHGERFRVPRWLARLVADGHLGVKSGRGLIEHVPAPVALSELPLAPAARPRTAFARVAVRGPGHLASRFLGALMARPDRRLVVERAEAPALLHALAAGDPRAAETLGPRLDVVEPGALAGDLLLDARDEPLDEKRRALAAVSPASPVLVCAPAGALAELLGCVAAPLGLMGAAPGFGGLVELVRGPGAGAFRELLLEAAGRVVDVEDGPVRPLAALAAPRLLEARRVVEEGLVTADALRRVMGGEDLLGEADAWGARALGAVSSAIALLERSVT